MNVLEELLGHITNTSAPDKERILQTRGLANELASGISDRALAKKLVRELNMSYLNLQFSTLADDPAMAVKCRKNCIEVVMQIEENASAGRDGQAPAEVGYGDGSSDGTVEKSV